MKKYLLSLVTALFMIGFTTTTNAQNVSESMKKPKLSKAEIVQKRSEMMAKQLMLDDATAAKFKTVYSQYLKDEMDCRQPKRAVNKASNRQDTASKTDAEIEKDIMNRFEQSQKLLDLRKNYYSKFRDILTPRQILKVYDSERNFSSKFNKERQKREKGRQMRRNGKNNRSAMNMQNS